MLYINEANNFTILGRFIEIIDDLNDEVIFTVNLDNKEVTIYSSKDLLPTINKYLQGDELISVKGHLEINNHNSIKLYADKILCIRHYKSSRSYS